VLRRMTINQTTITATELRDRARAHMEQLRGLLPDVTGDAWPAFLTLALVPLRLAKLDAAEVARGAPQADIPQWRRQWALWRAARRKRL